MSFIGPHIDNPPPPSAPPSPVSSDAAVAQETRKNQDQAAADASKAQGRAATILTGGAGLTGPAISSKRTLLGA